MEIHSFIILLLAENGENEYYFDLNSKEGPKVMTELQSPTQKNVRKKPSYLAKSYHIKCEEVNHQWYVFDATGKTLGRLASEITKILRGKHKASFTPNVDCGDGVIIINAEKIHVTGAKEAQKIYRYHTGAMSGMREVPYRRMKERKPTYIVEHAVKGMMPSSRLAEHQLRRLRVFAGESHGMEAQKPINANI